MTGDLLLPLPIEAVLFDFHGTLFDAHSPGQWIAAAHRLVATGGGPDLRPGADLTGLARHLDDVWTHARKIDPSSERDRDPVRHREVFRRAVMLRSEVDETFADALYAVMADQWQPFDDTVAVLNALRENGIRTLLLSNIGRDVRPRLRACGVAGLLDDVVLSYEVGLIKPDPQIFALAVERLGVPAERALMVGDSPLDDTGGTPLGLRTLILPRIPGRVRGLTAVLRLVLGPAPASRPPAEQR
ncbi:MAG TPA: HAD-IA family hydrolase [Kineosporiaceae bacterium]|nr:HAD-IA family hydrolase [Kineosporiaceae bacterium]